MSFGSQATVVEWANDLKKTADGSENELNNFCKH